MVVGLFVFELLIGLALTYFDNGELDSAWEQLPESFDWYSAFTSNLIISFVVSIGIVSILFASIVGVLLFKNWGRWLYLGSMFLVLPISLITGPSIYFAWESALWDITNMLNGALILAMFLQPFANEFNKERLPKNNS